VDSRTRGKAVVGVATGPPGQAMAPLALGMTAGEVAEQLGVSTSMVSRGGRPESAAFSAMT
jgi:hypothetical protein